MVAANSTATTTPNPNNYKPSSRPTRPPLLEGDNNNNNNNKNSHNVVPPPTTTRRPKSRDVHSRYMTSSSSSSTNHNSNSTPLSRRSPSPSVPRTVGPTRSLSVERRRVATTPRPNTNNTSGNCNNTTSRNNNNNNSNCFGNFSSNCNEGSVVKRNAAKMLFTSTRSLSVSFQGESFALQVSKAKPTPTPRGGGDRRNAMTPERRKTTSTSSNSTTPLLRGGGGGIVDQSQSSSNHRWPARLRGENVMSKSLDCTDERRKLGGGSGSVVRALLQKSMIDQRSSSSNCSIDGNSQLGLTGIEKSSTVEVHSDGESVSSSSTSGVQECVQGKNAMARGINVQARFWQDSSSNNRLRPESPSGKNTGLKASAGMGPPKLIPLKILSNDSPILSPKSVMTSRGLSPLRGAIRPQSPSKMASVSSPTRGMASPTRGRNGMGGSSNVPSILSFAADVRRGRIGENKIDDAHSLRLLYNRLLQWRFINARANATISAQTMTAEKSLYNAWMTTSDLHDLVKDKRKLLQLLRQQLKLASILKEQMVYLEEWALMDRDHSSSLSGATEALMASTLRLPVGGARAEIQNVKDAICAAVDVMQAMASSICSLLAKVDETNSLVSELIRIAAKERTLLGQCKDLFSTLAVMQVKDCSLRTHILQVQRISLPTPNCQSVKLI